MKTLLLSAIVPFALLTQSLSTSRAADTYEADCFKPFKPDTKTLQYPAKTPPYRVALANGFYGNTWRIEMVKCLQQYAEDPEIKPFIKELKIVSTGTDVAAQIGAIDNFINAGYDLIIINAVSPTAFKPVIERAKQAGVLLISYDNCIDSDQVLAVNEDQVDAGRRMAQWLLKYMGTKGNVIEVRGVAGNPVDLERHRVSTSCEIRRKISRSWRSSETGMMVPRKRRLLMRSRFTESLTVCPARVARPAQSVP